LSRKVFRNISNFTCIGLQLPRKTTAHGFGPGSCSFSGFQPCETTDFKVAVPKLKFWNSLKYSKIPINGLQGCPAPGILAFYKEKRNRLLAYGFGRGSVYSLFTPLTTEKKGSTENAQGIEAE
jgi:hypothetical protein